MPSNQYFQQNNNSHSPNPSSISSPKNENTKKGAALELMPQLGSNQHFTATAHKYICNNLNNLANSVQPDKKDLSFLENFLKNPALKELIDVTILLIT
jgi:geranylgeranyl pyrophosphate synthase